MRRKLELLLACLITSIDLITVHAIIIKGTTSGSITDINDDFPSQTYQVQAELSALCY
jgi:hypothetical protein